MMMMMMMAFLLQGMVEKWLLQVEDMMISSVRKVVLDSIQAYKDTPRKRWVIDWPGQVILCVSTIFWTSEVIEAMAQKDGLQVSATLWISDWATSEISHVHVVFKQYGNSSHSIGLNTVKIATCSSVAPVQFVQSWGHFRSI